MQPPVSPYSVSQRRRTADGLGRSLTAAAAGHSQSVTHGLMVSQRSGRGLVLHTWHGLPYTPAPLSFPVECSDSEVTVRRSADQHSSLSVPPGSSWQTDCR